MLAALSLKLYWFKKTDKKHTYVEGMRSIAKNIHQTYMNVGTCIACSPPPKNKGLTMQNSTLVMIKQAFSYGQVNAVSVAVHFLQSDWLYLHPSCMSFCLSVWLAAGYVFLANSSWEQYCAGNKKCGDWVTCAVFVQPVLHGLQSLHLVLALLSDRVASPGQTSYMVSQLCLGILVPSH